MMKRGLEEMIAVFCHFLSYKYFWQS